MPKPPSRPSGRPQGRRSGPNEPPRRRRTAPRGLWLYGRHAVFAALANPRRQVERVVATAEFRQRFASEWPRPVAVETADRAQLDDLLGPGAVHQGVAARVLPLPLLAIEDLIAHLPATGPAQVLVLDEVTDPRNVGAILRSAAAFGAAGVVVTRHNAAEETGALAKAASGALDTLAVAEAGNLRRDLERLQAAGFWCLGLDHPAPSLVGAAPPPDRLAWVLGAEGRGLRRLTAETCDALVAIPIAPAMESLNVSNAAAIALYEWCRCHGLPTEGAQG
ncbi:MAG: 23S rRNA (guanosine(2251)-2'-O)-methyltransferase RlmB [Alphaproteobacteria bacterium]|nr:23S rRNA (guanosine(2251)-2'-O)-methyltransferase RlmB [Alphaproteobacteria bacterium]MCB9927799.1 23S rRNA (guanosine(2251)-2'-O)-methyltransferase RlmB [Alphaproteobacteria bacterium]